VFDHHHVVFSRKKKTLLLHYVHCDSFDILGPLQDILATGIPLTKATTTTTTTIATETTTSATTTTKVEVHSPFSEAGTPTSHVLATKLRKSQTTPTARKVPKATFKVRIDILHLYPSICRQTFVSRCFKDVRNFKEISRSVKC